MTHRSYTETNGISQRTAAYRFGQCGVGGYSADAELTLEQLDALTARFGGSQKNEQKKRVAIHSMPLAVNAIPYAQGLSKDALCKKSASQILVENIAQMVPQKAAQNVQTEPAKSTANKTEGIILFYSPFAVTLVSIALTCCGLFMFAGWYGAGLGSMFGLFLFSAALVARNSEKGDTSEAALKTVLHLELGACLLHPFTFYRSFLNMGVSAEWWVLMGAAAVCSGFVALISYNAVMLIRNYNAEK